MLDDRLEGMNPRLPILLKAVATINIVTMHRRAEQELGLSRTWTHQKALVVHAIDQEVVAQAITAAKIILI